MALRQDGLILPSDALAGASPEVLAAVVAAAQGDAAPYGGDEWTGRLNAAFSALFECDCHVVPVSSGMCATRTLIF